MPLIKHILAKHDLVKYLLAAALYSLAACSQLPVNTAPVTPVVAAQQLSALQQQQFAEGKALLVAGQYSAAKNLFSALAAQQGSFAGIWYNLALSQWRAGDVTQAQQTLVEVVRVAADYPAALQALEARQDAGMAIREAGDRPLWLG